MDIRHQRLLNNFGPVRHAILMSSRDPQQGVHVVYGTDSIDFVLSNMKEELETRTGLRLVLPDLKHCVLHVKESPFLATLAQCRNTLVVLDVYGTLDEVHKNTLQQAVKEAEHPDGRTVFIQRGSLCRDWVLNKLETNTLIIYPHDAGHHLNRETDFWATVGAFLESAEDTRQQRLLNNYGPIRHALLTSSRDPQQRVHVVYGIHSTDFVLSKMKEVLETRTGLRLVLPDLKHDVLSVKESPFLATLALCRNTLVVIDDDFRLYGTFLQRAMSRSDVYGNILQQAVKEAEHAGSQIVFIQRGETCPDWVLNRLETSTVMMYPEFLIRHDQTARFWRALAEVFETSDMDLHHQRLLNSFGPVRHAALTSSRDPQQGVHVVYDAESSNFVLTELKEELEQRTGLRLVLPDMEHKALSEQGNQPDDTLTMQGSEFCATLALCRKTCVVLDFRLRYSRSGAYDKMMQQAVKEADHPDGQTVFIQRGETCPGWVLDRQETCTVIKYCRTKHSSYEEMETEFWKPLTACIESKIEIQNAGGNVAVQTGETRDKQSTQYQCLELCGEDNSKRKIELTSGNCGSEYSDSPSSHSVPVKFMGPVTNPGTDEGQQTQPVSLPPPGYVSTAPQPQSQIPSADDTSEGKSATDAQRVQNQTPLQPIFSSKWQTVDTVTSSGGTVRKQCSDVILTVPSDAVDEDSQVDIHTAVCTNIDRVRQVVKLSEDECVSSPMAEYWAGHEFRFKKSVSITLPHFLPPDPDPSLVRVYRVTRRPDGEIVSSRLRPEPSSSIDTTAKNKWSMGSDDTAVSQANQREDAAYRTAKEAEPTLPTDVASPTMKVEDFPEHCLDQDVEWEEAATFQLTTGGHVIIITNRFSGYVCTYCGRHGPPVLNVLVCGTHTQESADRQTAEVSVHVWDGRIHIADFRQDYGIGIQNHILCSRTLDVLPDLLDSRLHMLLAINKHYKNDWQHSLGDNDLPLIPAQQRHDLRHVLSSCDTRDCRNSSHITRPISAYWMLETLPDRHPQPWLQCAVYVCQVASNTEPSWSDREGVERSASLPVKLRNQEAPVKPASHTAKEKTQVEAATQTAKEKAQTANQKTQIECGTQTDDKSNLTYQPLPSDNGNAVSHTIPDLTQDVSGAAGHQNGQINTRVKQRMSDHPSHADGNALNEQRYPPFQSEVAMAKRMDKLTTIFQRHRTETSPRPFQNAGNQTPSVSNGAQAHGSSVTVRGQSADAQTPEQRLPVTPFHAQSQRDDRDRASVNDVLQYAASTAAGAVSGSSYSVVNQNFYISQPRTNHMTNHIGKIQGETTNLASTVTSNHGAPSGSGLNPLANALPSNEGNNSQSPALQASGGHGANGLEYERNGSEYERNGLDSVHGNETAQLENENQMDLDPQNGEHLTDTKNPVRRPEEE